MKSNRLVVFLLILAVGLTTSDVFAAMSDAEAVNRAAALWGQYGSIAKFRKAGDANWTYQVGCFSRYGILTATPFLIIAEGISWDAAFKKVDLTKNGPVTYGGAQALPESQFTVYRCNP